MAIILRNHSKFEEKSWNLETFFYYKKIFWLMWIRVSAHSFSLQLEAQFLEFEDIYHG